MFAREANCLDNFAAVATANHSCVERANIIINLSNHCSIQAALNSL